jgi:hypothetical protein
LNVRAVIRRILKQDDLRSIGANQEDNAYEAWSRLVNRAQRRGARSRRPEKVNVPSDQIYDIVDTILVPEDNRTVTVMASERGRLALGKVFPEITLPWRAFDLPGGAPCPEAPVGWKKIAWLNVSGLAHSTRHNLPPIYGDTPLDEATPKSVAFVLACAMKNQGVRAMILDIDKDLVVQDCMIIAGAGRSN